MSDPVTNVELDDVLSSIRRLVADRDPAPRPVVPFSVESAAPETETDAANTFLLTPALKVDAAPPRAPMLLFPSRPVVTADAAPEAGLVARLAAKLEAAVTREAAEFEPDGSEDDPVIDWSAPMLGEPPIFRSRQTPGPAAVAPGPVKMILPLSEADNLSDAPLRDAIEAAAPVAAAPVTFHHRAEVAVPPPVVAADPQQDDSADLSADLARASRDLRDGDPAVLTLANGQILDEEMLRSLVTEIVRQELQGTLGERITRNVRKLVRREIFKVLSAQDLE